MCHVSILMIPGDCGSTTKHDSIFDRKNQDLFKILRDWYVLQRGYFDGEAWGCNQRGNYPLVI